jgi:hypothetical protein
MSAWGSTSMNGFPAPVSMPMGPEYKELLEYNHKLLMMYTELMEKHTDLLTKHKEHVEKTGMAVVKAKGGQMAKQSGLKAVQLGVIRLDYNYPPAPGDIDCPDSYDYDVIYRVIPGLTFSMCQSGRMTPAVEKNFIDGIVWLHAKGCCGITGDCGFMMYFQRLARMHTTLPVFMSSLSILPAVTCGFSSTELIAIFTANSKTLAPMRPLIKDECGVDPEERRFIIVGCEDVPGFEAVAAGDKVDVNRVTPGMVAKARETQARYSNLRGILLECTELPPYADAIRQALHPIPVWDAITACNFFISGCKDNERFGLNNWQQGWDGVQEKYSFGSNLTEHQLQSLVNRGHAM